MTIDISTSILFFRQECTAEEIWWLVEIVEDLTKKAQNCELLQSMRIRAEQIQDRQKREKSLKDIDEAFDFFLNE